MIAVGEPAPVVELPDTNGAPVRLGGDAGACLVVFLPAAFTPVCSGELSDLGRIRPAVEVAGVATYAVACDSMFALRTWREDAEIGAAGLPMLSDFWPHGHASRAYGAFDDDRGISTRASYLIDDDGVVVWSTHSPAGIARDLAEHLAAVERWRG